MMALSGVRISWLILARNSDFADDAFSACWRAATSSCSVSFQRVMSRNTAQNCSPSASTRPRIRCSENKAALSPPADDLAGIVARWRFLVLHEALQTRQRDPLALGCEQRAESSGRPVRPPRNRTAVRLRHWPSGCGRRDRASQRRRLQCRESKRGSRTGFGRLAVRRFGGVRRQQQHHGILAVDLDGD